MINLLILWSLIESKEIFSNLKNVLQNLSNIKLAPHNSGWNHGSGTKSPAQISSNSMISLTKNNMYSVLENVQADPSSLRSKYYLILNNEIRN